jgi:8-oxo-dGTP pyrophosphatase MutT (NUDIX family)
VVDPLVRRCSKLFVVDSLGRLLLFEGFDPSNPERGTWWFTPGGACESGESLEAAARRELGEETGVVVGDVGPVVLTRRFTWKFEGSRYDQEEHYFVVRVPSSEVRNAGWTDNERRVALGWRWWTLEELRATAERVFPDGLAELVEPLLA